jgi:phage gp29-like protein
MFERFKRFFNDGPEQKITKPEAVVTMPNLETISSRFLTLMENTSYDLLPSGTDLEDFILEMEKDPDIVTELKNFKSFVTQGQIAFIAANENQTAQRAAEICQTVLTPGVIKDFYNKTMHCLDQGYSVIWAKFKEENRLFTIDQLQESKFYNFAFNSDGILINANTYEELKQPNWIQTTYDERYGDKYGRSIFLPLYWIAKFEKLGYKQIVTLFDKLGVPSFAALIEPSGDDNIDQKRANAIATSIKNIRSHSGIALTAKDIKKLEASSGAIREIDDFIRHMKESKTRVIMGALLTSGTTGSSGTYNLAANHKAITEMRVNDVGELIASSLTDQLIPLICRLNVSMDIQPEDMPKASYSLPVFSELDELLKVVNTFENVGVKAGTIKTVYKMPIENPDDEILKIKPKETQAAFSENHNSRFEDFFFRKKG